MASISVLRHAAALQDARTESARLQAWQHACAFIQSQLKTFSSCENAFRDSCLHLLRSCQVHAEQFSRTNSSWLPHLATLQYQVLRSLHERGDNQLVVSEGTVLLCFLAEHCEAADVNAVKTNCLVALVSSCARGLLKLEPSTLEILHREVKAVVGHDPAQAAQLAKNLVLSQLNTATTDHGKPLDQEAAHEALTVIEACIPCSSDLARKLVTQVAKALPASTITSLLQHSSPLPYRQVHIKAILSEYARRSGDEFPSQLLGDALPATALLAQLSRALVPGCPTAAPTRKQLVSIPQTLSSLSKGAADEILALSFEAAFTSITASLHEAVKISQGCKAPQHSSNHQCEAVSVLLTSCSSFLGNIDRLGTAKAADALSYTLHCCAALVKYTALQLRPQGSELWTHAMSQALDVLCQCCQQADSLLKMLPESSRRPGQLLPQALRKVSASTFNAAIDVREEQPRFALGLLRASGSCCVLVATRCMLTGEPAALQQLAHDSVKRCMLGFKTASDVQSEEHFVSTGLLILSALYRTAEGDGCRCGILQDVTRLLLLARNTFTHLQTHLHGVCLASDVTVESDASVAEECASEASGCFHMHAVDASTYEDADVELIDDSCMATSANGSSESKNVAEDAEQYSAQTWLRWQQSMIRVASSVHMVMLSLSDMHGAHSCRAGMVLEAIPALLDCRAIASLCLCSPAVVSLSDSVSLAASFIAPANGNASHTAPSSSANNRASRPQANSDPICVAAGTNVCSNNAHAATLANLACMQLCTPRLVAEGTCGALSVSTGAFSVLYRAPGSLAAAQHARRPQCDDALQDVQNSKAMHESHDAPRQCVETPGPFDMHQNHACITVLLEASAAFQELLPQRTEEQPAALFDQTAFAAASAATVRLVEIAGELAAPEWSVQDRSLAVELYMHAAVLLEQLSEFLGVLPCQATDTGVNIEQLIMKVLDASPPDSGTIHLSTGAPPPGNRKKTVPNSTTTTGTHPGKPNESGDGVDVELVGSAVLCSQRLALAACEVLERACIVSEACLLEGSGSSSEVQMSTADEGGGERGAGGGEQTRQNVLSVCGVGCWHLAVQMLQLTQQSGRVFGSLGLSHRTTRWQHLSQKLLTSLELPLACISFLEPPSKDQPLSPSPTDDSFNLPQDTAKPPKPPPLSQQYAEASTMISRAAAAESAAVMTASAALVATECSLPMLGAGLAAQSIAIARNHALDAEAPNALWHALNSKPMSASDSVECVADSEHSGNRSLLAWGEELLRRCPVPCTDGGCTSGMHGAVACSGQENSEPMAEDQQDSAEPAAVGKGKAKQRAVRGKAKNGNTANSTAAIPSRSISGADASSLPTALSLFGDEMLCVDTAAAWKLLEPSDCSTFATNVPHVFLFPSFDVFEDSRFFQKHQSGEPKAMRESCIHNTCTTTMHDALAAIHKRLAVSLHLDALDSCIRASQASAPIYILDHSSSKFFLTTLQPSATPPSVYRSLSLVQQCNESVHCVASTRSSDPNTSSAKPADETQRSARNDRAASATSAKTAAGSAAAASEGEAEGNSRSTRATRSRVTKASTAAPIADSSTTSKGSKASTTAARATATSSGAVPAKRGGRKATHAPSCSPPSIDPSNAVSATVPAPAPSLRAARSAPRRAGSNVQPTSSSKATAKATVNASSQDCSGSSLSAMHEWLGSLVSSQRSTVSTGVDRSALGRFLGSVAAFCTRNCLQMPSAGSAESTSSAHAWYSPIEETCGDVNGSKSLTYAASNEHGYACSKSESSVGVLLLCAAIAATGVHTPASAPLLQQLAALSAAAGLSAVPLACMYAANSLANMHAALLSVATGAEGPPKPEKRVSAEQQLLPQQSTGTLGMLGVLRCSDSIAWAADGERLATRTVQAITEAVFCQAFGVLRSLTCHRTLSVWST